MISTSTSTDFPSNEIGSDFKIPSGLNTWPSKYFNVFGDSVSGGEPMAFQQLIDIMHVEAPSSMIMRKMVFSLLII